MQLEAVLLSGEEGGGFGFKQVLDRRRTPMVVRDLIMRSGKGMDTAIHNLHEILHRHSIGRLGLANQAAN